jgi:CBS domain containing-hemolysin-like protein
MHPATLLVAYLLLALGVSFLCSLCESVVLSLGLSRVTALENANRTSGRLLRRMKANVERPLAGILTLNTVAHTVGAAGVGAESLILFGEAWIALTSAVLTILILVFSEIIPKTLGVVYANQLAPLVAYTVEAMVWATYPLVLGFHALSRLISTPTGPRFSREEFALLAELGYHEGALADKEYRVIRNLLRLRRTRVKDVHTPRTVVFMLPDDMTCRQAIEQHGPIRFARMPVYHEHPDNITGIVLRHRLYEAAHDDQPDQPLADLAQPVHAIPETAPLDAALNDFVQRREHLFLVIDEHGGTEGILTLEDAIETLLGEEIIDETDQVADMRQLAGALFQSRLRGRRF